MDSYLPSLYNAFEVCAIKRYTILLMERYIKNMTKCNHTYFEMQCSQIITLDVYIFTNNTMCLYLKYVVTRDAIYIKTSNYHFYCKVP